MTTRKQRFLTGRKKAMRMYAVIRRHFEDNDAASVKKMLGIFRKTRNLPKSLREDELNARKAARYRGDISFQ